MLKPALNLAGRITAGETAKPSEAPDTAIPHTRKAGPIEHTHPRNKALPKSDRQSKKEPRMAPTENNPWTNPHK